MTNTVQPAVAESAKRPGGSDEENLLQLSGIAPTTVYVKAMTDPFGKPIAGFASQPAGQYFTGGLRWMSDGKNALFVNLSLTEVSGIQTDLPTSPPANGSQYLCLLPVRGAKVDFHMIVTFPSGLTHDPKILVTPINTEGDDSARSRKA